MPDEIDYVKNLIEKREKESKGAIPIDEWLSTEEGKAVINTFPIKERNLFLDTYNKISPYLNYIQKFSNDEIRLGVSSKFNKGGTPMMEKQMEMFEDGGLKDEGGMIDKESGNKVPPGSTRKEVRDDIPAQLSEGEFVFPADVVRFIGLEKLMKLRQQAKMGLKKMEEMGQMGNSDEATLPDDLPFDETDLLIIQDGKPMQMAKGGALTAAEGTDVRDLPTQQSAREQAQAQFIDFNDLIGTGPGGAQLTIREYKNEDGVSIRIRFAGSTPIDNIRSEEHTSELQSQSTISYAVFCLKKKKTKKKKK